jgi:hypothetical protein
MNPSPKDFQPFCPVLRNILGKPEGQVAIDIVRYNPGKIEECLQSQSSILKSMVFIPALGKVEYGACVLWLVPMEQRRFSL